MHLTLAIGVSSTGVGGKRVLCLPICTSVFPSSYLVSTKNGHFSLKAAAGTRSRRVLGKSTFTLSRAQDKEVLAPAEDDDEDEDADEYEYEDEDEYEYEDDRETRQWKANQPTGFGHGKTYDTSLEDKLLAEVEQSRKANSKSDKHDRKVKDEKQHKEPIRHKALESIPAGVNVRIGNLPRKKNIARDLQASFKGYPGLLHINPVEFGNKKTREPICKGLAFLTFKNEDVANRFVTRFNGESIIFGKIEKKISCCLANPSGLRNSNFIAQTSTTAHTLPRLRIREKRNEYTEGLLDSATLLHQQKENHAKFSMKLGNEHISWENEVNNSVRTSFSSIAQNDDLDPSDTRPSWKDLKMDSPTKLLNDDALKVDDAVDFYDHIANFQNDSHKDSVLNQDLNKGIQHSDNCPKISDDFMDSNGERSLENVEKISSNNGKIGKVDVFDYRGKQLEPAQQGSYVAKASGTETWDASIDLTSQNRKQRQLKKSKMEHKSKNPIEANPSDSTAVLHGSANRLKKQGRNVLSAVLVKYGQNAESTKS